MQLKFKYLYWIVFLLCSPSLMVHAQIPNNGSFKIPPLKPPPLNIPNQGNNNNNNAQPPVPPARVDFGNHDIFGQRPIENCPVMLGRPPSERGALIQLKSCESAIDPRTNCKYLFYSQADDTAHPGERLGCFIVKDATGQSHDGFLCFGDHTRLSQDDVNRLLSIRCFNTLEYIKAATMPGTVLITFPVQPQMENLP
ncbi:MAG: hypothetical protein HYU97_07380 [Deltaproteobacteria bacterium]|nr:hypothetical protein [Deltaproteobacteria bacterium]